MTLEELKDAIKSIKVEYPIEKTYWKLYNTMDKYWSETNYLNECLGEHLFEEFEDYEGVEMRAKWEIEDGGLLRLWHFINDADLTDDLYKINAYGNLENVGKEDIECLKEMLLTQIDDELMDIDYYCGEVE